MSSHPEAEEQVDQLRAELRRLTTALEDVVALALSSGDLRQRVILMQRRAAAALSGADREPTPPLPDGERPAKP